MVLPAPLYAYTIKQSYLRLFWRVMGKDSAWTTVGLRKPSSSRRESTSGFKEKWLNLVFPFVGAIYAFSSLFCIVYYKKYLYKKIHLSAAYVINILQPNKIWELAWANIKWSLSFLGFYEIFYCVNFIFMLVMSVHFLSPQKLPPWWWCFFLHWRNCDSCM